MLERPDIETYHGPQDILICLRHVPLIGKNHRSFVSPLIVHKAHSDYLLLLVLHENP